MSRASTSDTNPLALDSQEWVTLASGQQVRVDGLGYRPNVAVVLFNAEGKVFTCRRCALSKFAESKSRVHRSLILTQQSSCKAQLVKAQGGLPAVGPSSISFNLSEHAWAGVHSGLLLEWLLSCDPPMDTSALLIQLDIHGPPLNGT